jgi:hypothetical protein
VWRAGVVTVTRTPARSPDNAGAKDDDRVEVIAVDNLGNPTTPHPISVTVQ